MSAPGRENKEAIGWEARSQYQGKPLEGPLAVTVALYWPTKRNHDVDNIKALLDACTGIVWVDDGQIQDLHTTKAFDNGNPRVEMSIISLDLVPKLPILCQCICGRTLNGSNDPCLK